MGELGPARAREHNHSLEPAVHETAEGCGTGQSRQPLLLRHRLLLREVGGKGFRMQAQRLQPDLAQGFVIPRGQRSHRELHTLPPKRAFHSSIWSSVTLAKSTSGSWIFWPASSCSRHSPIG